MSAETDLLPLDMPRRFEFTRQEVRALARDYARANVAHAIAPLQAEIEALRAEVVESRRKWADTESKLAACDSDLHEFQQRAERLAGALRDARECGNDGDWQSARRIIDAALEQENGRG